MAIVAAAEAPKAETVVARRGGRGRVTDWGRGRGERGAAVAVAAAAAALKAGTVVSGEAGDGG